MQCTKESVYVYMWHLGEGRDGGLDIYKQFIEPFVSFFDLIFQF